MKDLVIRTADQGIPFTPQCSKLAVFGEHFNLQGRRMDWHLPQQHVPTSVRNARIQAWICARVSVAPRIRPRKQEPPCLHCTSHPCFHLLFVLSFPADAAETWYVRADGGNASECDGTADQAYDEAATINPAPGRTHSSPCLPAAGHVSAAATRFTSAPAVTAWDWAHRPPRTAMPLQLGMSYGLIPSGPTAGPANPDTRATVTMMDARMRPNCGAPSAPGW
jgi:hypothetical protein